MAYELGTYSEELRQEHKQDRHQGKPLEYSDCPLCIKKLDDAEDAGLDPIGDFFTDLQRAADEHEGHSPATHYTECHKCAADFGKGRP